LNDNEPERVLKRAGELGVLSRLHPSLKGNGWLADTFAKAREADKRTTLSNLYLCLLIYNLSERQNIEFASRLNFPKNTTETMKQTLKLKEQLHNLANAGLKPSDVYLLLHGFSAIAIQANAVTSESPVASRQLNLYLRKLRYVKPMLNGEDLQNMGIPAGPEIKEVLGALQKAKLDGDILTRKDEEKFINSLH
jgi:tRNA nucleotidyltransferase (CCA-adding enzyme)